MSDDVQRFLLSLGTDGELLARYRQDPTSVLDEAGVSETFREVLMSRDLLQIRACLPADYGGPLAVAAAVEYDV